MFFNEGLAPPVKFYPMTTPDFVAGAAVTGNYNATEVTERGKTFLLTVANLMSNAFKVMPKDEKTSEWTDSIWPGIETDLKENDWQGIGFVGKKSAPAADWGDLTRVDLDFNGAADQGRSLGDDIPLGLYGANAQVDYHRLWNEEKNQLSATQSFFETVKSGQSPDSAEKKLAFLIGFLEAKRAWVYGLKGLGLDPINPNAEGAAQRFETAFQSANLQEAGALNIQMLQNFIGIRQTVAARFQELVEDSLVAGSVAAGAKSYYRGITASVNIGPLRGRINEFRADFAVLKKLVAENRLAQAADKLNRTTNHLQSIISKTDELKERVGLFSASLSTAAAQLPILTNELIDLGTSDWAAILAKLTAIEGQIDPLENGVVQIKEQPETVIDQLYQELADPLSADELATDLKKLVKDSFNLQFNKPISFVVGIQGTNGAFTAINRTNQQRYEAKKDDKYQEKLDEARAVAKHYGTRKAEQKRAEAENNQKNASAAQNNQTKAKKGR